ncbi:MAG: ArdC-like ssDNA-binding domain-containing protein [Sphingobacteriales bacterium]
MSTNFKPLTDQVAERLREQLLKNTSVFQQDKPLAMPFNPVSGKSYRGAAALILLMEQRPDPRWLSLKNASFNKTPVLKGEHGTLISFYKTNEMKPVLKTDGTPELKENGKQKFAPVKLDEAKLETAFMFNATQLKEFPELEPRHEQSPILRLETILNYTQVEVKTDYAIDDLVELANEESKLKLPEVNEDKTSLRKQIASLFIAAELGLEFKLTEPGLPEIWGTILKDEPAELFKAANDAQKIADHVLGFEKKRELSKTLDKGDVIPYKGDSIQVLAILKGGTAQVRNEEGKKWKVGPADGLYKSLIEARNNPSQKMEKEHKEELAMAR